MADRTNFNPFSPLFIQRLSSGIFFLIYVLSPFIGWPLILYLLTSRFWWIAIIYLLWFYNDRETPERGGRSVSWIQYSKHWSINKTYFNADVIFDKGFSLDPTKNYLFCFTPHGIIPNGLFINIMSGVSKFHQMYPNFKVACAVIKFTFFTPILRDWIMGMGFISCTAKAISYVLSKPEGGHVVCLSPGGAEEAYHSQPGKYCSIIRNRKGFVKMALRHGSPLVPTILFGEPDQFYQVEGGRFHSFQEFIRQHLKIAPVIFYGTGFFWKYGLVPRQVILKAVVGVPIEVPKICNPTIEEIDELQARFINELMNLFEKYKHQFLDNPDDTKLVLL